MNFRKLHIACSAILLVLTLTRCECSEDLGELRPKLQVTPTEIDMGRRQVAETSFASFTIGNVGTAFASCSFEIEAATAEELGEAISEFDDISGAAFQPPEGPSTVSPNQSVQEEIAFTPPSRGKFAGTLVVISDDLNNPRIRLPLRGEGGPPLIEVEPERVDFEVANEGPGAAREVRVRNVGFDRLDLSNMYIVDDYASAVPQATPVFRLENESLSSASIAGGQVLAVVVRMEPTAGAVAWAQSDQLTGKLVIESNAENEPSLEVPLSGVANLAPRAVAVELFSRQSTVKVGIGREVVIDGSESTDPEGEPITFDWELVEQPEASEALLIGAVSADECTADAECDTAEGYRCVGTASSSRCRQVARTFVTPDVVGSFVVRLRATDARGAYSFADVTILPRDLVVVLRWSQTDTATCFAPDSAECEMLSLSDRRLYCCGQTDIDLHLVQPGGTLGDYGTCPATCTSPGESLCSEDSDEHVATCRQFGTDCAYANRYPEWGVPGRADDPRLDLDDVRGYGPEVISLNNPPDGAYTAYVHFCTDRIGEPTQASLSIYVEGELQYEVGPQLLPAEGSAWVAATLVRSGGPTEGAWMFRSTPGLMDASVPADLCQR